MSFQLTRKNFTIGSDTEKVAFHGPNERIGWLLQVKYVTDQTTSIVVNVIPTFAGITDVWGRRNAIRGEYLSE